MKIRTHTCGELNAVHVGQTVVLNGWVHTRRDHGNVIFYDIRDRRGMTQVVFNQEINAKAHEQAHQLRSEYVVAIQGTVSKRPAGSENPKLPTGQIEVMVHA